MPQPTNALAVESLAELEAALRSDRFIAARRRIFRQLIESLVYEGLLSPETEAAGEAMILRIHSWDAGGRPVTYQCQARRRFSFDRVRLIETPVVRTDGEATAEADSFALFLEEVQPSLGADPDRLVHFTTELEQTLLKDSIAQFRRHHTGEPLHGLSYDELESGLMDGHPYHPAYKSRMGFDYHENDLFGPESAPVIHPLWIAAHRESTRLAASHQLDSEAFLRRELGEAAYDRFAGELCRRGFNPADYRFLPVHPWQWRERVVANLYPDLREGRLVPLGTVDAYRPQQSIRTLTNITAPEKAYLKLSLSILNTSTSRILAPHTTQNAPLISDWLKGMTAEDPYWRDELRTVLLGEVLGVAYDRLRPAPGAQASYGILSCIWRESLHPYLSPGEEAVPFAGICQSDRDGRPFIDPWVRKAGLETWVRRLLAASILPVVHLLHAHGIALEAHAQNMVLILKDGVPERVALKDFHDGIRFANQHLAAPGRRPPLHATPAAHARVNRNSYIESDSATDVRDFMHDAFFFINLSEIAIFLADHYGLAEERFWSIARTLIERYQQRFPEHRDRHQLFDLFAATVQVEQLTKRRLFPDSEVRVHAVRNPLAMVDAAADGEEPSSPCCAPTR